MTFQKEEGKGEEREKRNHDLAEVISWNVSLLFQREKKEEEEEEEEKKNRNEEKEGGGS